MQTDGGEGTWKVPKISSSLLALMTEREDDCGLGTWFILTVSKNCSFNTEVRGPN